MGSDVNDPNLRARLWGAVLRGRVTSRHQDGYVLIKPDKGGSEFGGRYGDLRAGDRVLIYTGDYFLPLAAGHGEGAR